VSRVVDFSGRLVATAGAQHGGAPTITSFPLASPRIWIHPSHPSYPRLSLRIWIRAVHPSCLRLLPRAWIQPWLLSSPRLLLLVWIQPLFLSSLLLLPQVWILPLLPPFPPASVPPVWQEQAWQAQQRPDRALQPWPRTASPPK